jgi:hypothetical protein
MTMANRRTMKLFAVAVLAGAAPAYAGNPTQSNAVAQSSRVEWRSRFNEQAIASITPRMLANGRVACGNTGGKTMSCDARAERELTSVELGLLAAKRTYDHELSAAIVLPRVLANARPACGNTGGKVSRPDDCSLAETNAAYAADDYYAKQSKKKQARITAAYDKLIVATEAAVAADPSLQVRLLENGRPACGNTHSKKKMAVDCVAAR